MRVAPRAVIASASERASFRSAQRLHKPQEFSAVMAARRVVRGELFDLHYSLASEGEIDLPGGHRITYVARPEQTGWKRAPDWKRRSATAGPFIRQLRDLLA